MHDLDRLKAQVSPGNPVSFEVRGQRLNGVVSTLGPRRAVVAMPDNSHYRVPYERIQPLGTPEDYSAREQGALENCRALLRKHGLSDWSAGLDDSVRRAGVCNYAKKQLSFARLFLRKASEQEILDTILHEIAHALAGFKHHHDAVWLEIARQIGCTGNRCHDIDFSLPRWIMRCPNGCFAVPRNRRSKRRICAKCGQPVKFAAPTASPEPTRNETAAANNRVAGRAQNR